MIVKIVLASFFLFIAISIILVINAYVWEQTDPYLLACQTILEESLISPLSLKIEFSETREIVSETVTIIEYNAANSYGTMLSGDIECRYRQPDPIEDDPSTVEGGVFAGAKAATNLIMKISQDGEVFVEACVNESDIDCDEQTLSLIIVRTRAFMRLIELEKR
jgi:hypothetical protein